MPVDSVGCQMKCPYTSVKGVEIVYVLVTAVYLSEVCGDCVCLRSGSCVPQ